MCIESGHFQQGMARGVKDLAIPIRNGAWCIGPDHFQQGLCSEKNDHLSAAEALQDLQGETQIIDETYIEVQICRAIYSRG